MIGLKVHSNWLTINIVDWVEGSQKLDDCLTKKAVSPNKLTAAIGRL